MRLILFLLAASLWGQTSPDYSNRVVYGAINAKEAVETRPFRKVTSVPSGSCSKDVEAVIYTNQLWGCVSGTWAQVGGGGGGTPAGAFGYIQINNSGAFGGIPLNTDGSGESAAQAASMAAVKLKVEDLTVPVTAGTDDNKSMLVNNSGVASLGLVTYMVPVTMDNGDSEITTANSCQTREVISDSVFKSIHLVSYNSTSRAGISGTIVVQVSRSSNTGTPSWTTLGTIGLSSASQAVDASLSGTTVAANSIVAFCVTSNSGVKKLTISPRFYIQ